MSYNSNNFNKYTNKSIEHKKERESSNGQQKLFQKLSKNYMPEGTIRQKKIGMKMIHKKIQEKYLASHLKETRNSHTN